MISNWRRQTALGLLSAALIALQLVLMQILAITQWHHFAYLVISTALLGFGASGTLLTLTRSWSLANSRVLVPLLMIASACSMAALGWLTQGLLSNFDSYLLFFSGKQLLRLAAIILCYFQPFFLAATAIGLLFIIQVEQIGAYYFANLLGSGLGGVLALLLLWVLPAEQLTATLALIVLLAAILCLPARGRLLPMAVLFGAICCAASLFFPAPLSLSQYKDLSRALDLPAARIIASQPSPYGRVDALVAPAMRYAPGLSLTYTDPVPHADGIFNNGNFLGAIPTQPNADKTHLLSATTGALPFALARANKVLVLHAGTGSEVALALSHGAQKVVAVEPHAALLELLRKNYPRELQHFFANRSVSIVNLEPRTFLAGAGESYDLILLPTLGSFGGNLGLFALQEQNSLTLEGLSAAWQHLQPDGLLCINSWLDFPLRTPLRLATSIGRLLEIQGIAAPGKHLAVLRSWGTLSFCCKKSQLTTSDHKRIDRFADQYQFDRLLPGGNGPSQLFKFNTSEQDNLEELLTRAISSERQQLIAEYPFDIAPTRDDRPFFSQFLRWQSLPKLVELFGEQRLPFLELGSLIAVICFLQLSLAAIFLILLPLLKLGWKNEQRGWSLVYFASLGIGFMLVELSLIHRFVLYLGNPVYAAATIICILLACSGCGSLLSARYDPSPALLTKLCAGLAALLLCYSMALSPLLQQSMALPFTARVILALLLLTPAGLLMGFPFPLGLRLLNKQHPAAVPWAWGINGCLSVVSAALAAILAVELGFTLVFWLAAAAYATAAAITVQPS